MKKSTSKSILIMMMVLFILLSGCSSQKESTNNSNKVLKTKDFPKVTQNINDFKTTSADDFLSDSKPISIPENMKFTPMAYNDNGILLGIAELKNKKNLQLTKLDTKTGTYTKLKNAETDQSIIRILSASNDYILFQEYSQEVMNYYLYDLKNSTYKLFYQSKDTYSLNNDSAIIDKDRSYLFLTKNTADGSVEPINYELDNKTLQLMEFAKNNMISAPVLYKDHLYYLDTDRKNQTVQVKQYNRKQKRSVVLAEGNKADGYFSNLQTDGETLLVFTLNENESQQKQSCYKLDPETLDILPYFYADYMESMHGSQGYLNWAGETNINRVHPQYYFLDTANDLLYIYKDSILNFNSNSIAWTKFLVDEETIHKGEIFTSKYSQIMIKDLT